MAKEKQKQVKKIFTIEFSSLMEGEKMIDIRVQHEKHKKIDYSQMLGMLELAKKTIMDEFLKGEIK